MVRREVRQHGYLRHAGRHTRSPASDGGGIFDYALAIIVWHEMAYIDGADEAAARRADEQLWAEFVLAGRVDGVRGFKYLTLLKKRN